MNVFILKIIALATMIIDHAGGIIPEVFGLSYGTNIFRMIGRVAFPIFVYLIAEGFRHTKSPAKYLMRLGIFALVSEVPYDLAFKYGINFFSNTNIFYTLFLGGAAIAVYQRFCKSNSIAASFPALGFMILAEFLDSDYGAYGVAFIFIMYVIKSVKLRLAAMSVLCILQHAGLISSMLNIPHIPITYFLLIAATVIPVALIAFYNGKRGTDLKWFFYAAYPIHLAILAFI